VSPGQASLETTVNVAMQDSSGPFDYHLTRKMLALCAELDIPHRRDVYRFYRSDSASALQAGAETRTALIGPGVDASHGHERTHLEGIRRVAELVAAYLQTARVRLRRDRPGAARGVSPPGAAADRME
jgi:putative aminopeptidase FrvX